MAFRAPVLGYNTNVRHKGKLYHIQTEDSGIDHPHVITHLFADGGRIVASKKTSYADRVGSDGLAELVKKLMQAQHKAMFIALRDGAYDEDAPHDAAVETGTHPIATDKIDKPSDPAEPGKESAAESEPSRAEPLPASDQVKQEAKSEAATAESKAEATVESTPADAKAESKEGEAKAELNSPRPKVESARFERPKADLPKPEIIRPAARSDARLDPPKSGGRAEPARPPEPPKRPEGSKKSELRASIPAPPSYQGTQSASGAAEKPRSLKPPKPPARSLFGGELSNDKTLDEVILNYLVASDKDG